MSGSLLRSGFSPPFTLFTFLTLPFFSRWCFYCFHLLNSCFVCSPTDSSRSLTSFSWLLTSSYLFTWQFQHFVIFLKQVNYASKSKMNWIEWSSNADTGNTCCLTSNDWTVNQGNSLCFGSFVHLLEATYQDLVAVCWGFCVTVVPQGTDVL